MTRDDIISMARDCGINFHQARWPELERFAALVAVAERDRLKSAAECFRMCEHKGVCDEKAKSNETDCPAVLGKS